MICRCCQKGWNSRNTGWFLLVYLDLFKPMHTNSDRPKIFAGWLYIYIKGFPRIVLPILHFSWCYPKLGWTAPTTIDVRATSYEETSTLGIYKSKIKREPCHGRGWTWIIKGLQLRVCFIWGHPKNHQILQKWSAQECARRPKNCARKPKKCARTRKNTQENFGIRTPWNWLQDTVYVMVLLS